MGGGAHKSLIVRFACFTLFLRAIGMLIFAGSGEEGIVSPESGTEVDGFVSGAAGEVGD